MNKKAQRGIKPSGFLIIGGVVLIVLGMMTWQPIAYLGVLVFVAGLAAKSFLKI